MAVFTVNGSSDSENPAVINTGGSGEDTYLDVGFRVVRR